MKRILITGSNSYIGICVAEWLLREPDKYEVITVGTIDGEWKQADFSTFDAVFHVAGIAHVDPKPEMAPLYYAVNRDLAIEVARHAKEKGVKQFVFMSSMIVYHASKSLKGDYITEETTPDPNDFYGDSKLQAEIALREMEDENFRVAILRPCMIYGPGSKGNFPKLMKLATRTPVFPEWHNKRSMLYIDNLSEFVRQAVDRELNGTFHLQNPEYSDTVEIIRFFAEAANHKVCFSRFFNVFVGLGSFVLPQIPKMFADMCYSEEISTFDFNYQIVSLEESLKKML